VLLGRAKASVVILQETEKNQASFVKEADIVISAVGKKHFIKENWIKKGAVLIDVGVSYQGGKIFGDFEPSAYKKAALYTPVPGGVGPLTVICLLRNVVRIFLKESKAKTSIDRVY
jgi:methylenetetrahydrofolate dehydrogenase (NADP+)/methenyltetrahydrofolate cyclohydrolase